MLSRYALDARHLHKTYMNANYLVRVNASWRLHDGKQVQQKAK